MSRAALLACDLARASERTVAANFIPSCARDGLARVRVPPS